MKVLRNKARGKLLNIRAKYLPETLRVTPEHPVFVINRGLAIAEDDFASAATGGVFIKDGILRKNKVPAATLKLGDFLYYTPPKQEVYWDDITDETVELMGWFLAEGLVSKNQVKFILDKNEIEEAERLKSLLEKRFSPEDINTQPFPDWREREGLH